MDKMLRVLLVDDEPAILRMFRTALQTSKFTLSEARDGREALESLAAMEVDVVVTDVNMPGLDGLEFLRVVQGRYPHVPVIIMTGRPSVESSHRATEYGAVQFLIKPVLPTTLRAAIERAALLLPQAKAAISIRCTCSGCGRAGVGRRINGQWTSPPAEWFVDAGSERFLCSEICAQRGERRVKTDS